MVCTVVWWVCIWFCCLFVCVSKCLCPLVLAHLNSQSYWLFLFPFWSLCQDSLLSMLFFPFLFCTILSFYTLIFQPRFVRFSFHFRDHSIFQHFLNKYISECYKNAIRNTSRVEDSGTTAEKWKRSFYSILFRVEKTICSN